MDFTGTSFLQYQISKYLLWRVLHFPETCHEGLKLLEISEDLYWRVLHIFSFLWAIIYLDVTRIQNLGWSTWARTIFCIIYFTGTFSYKITNFQRPLIEGLNFSIIPYFQTTTLEKLSNFWRPLLEGLNISSFSWAIIYWFMTRIQNLGWSAGHEKYYLSISQVPQG